MRYYTVWNAQFRRMENKQFGPLTKAINHYDIRYECALRVCVCVHMIFVCVCSCVCAWETWNMNS